MRSDLPIYKSLTRSIKGVGRSLFDSSSHILRTATLWANEVCNRYDDVVWIIGDGRSGTTWLQEIIAKSCHFRTMYEPFHPESGGAFRTLPLNWYARPGDHDRRMDALSRQVFSGRFFHPNVDLGNRRLYYNGIVVKDIFANLFACWVSQHFPRIKIVMLVRNPFLVAISKNEKQSWTWMRDGADFLLMPSLVSDHLQQFTEAIRATSRDFIQQQILIWAILHYVPLRQDFKRPVYWLFYEDVTADPQHELSKLMMYLFGTDERCCTRLSSDIVDRPSRGSEGRASSFTNGGAFNWKNKLATIEVDAGLRTLERFGLDGLYGDGTTPRILSGVTVGSEL